MRGGYLPAAAPPYQPFGMEGLAYRAPSKIMAEPATGQGGCHVTGIKDVRNVRYVASSALSAAWQ